jgi:hypothetical protein
MTPRTHAPLGLTLMALALTACQEPTRSDGAGPRQPAAARAAPSTAPTGQPALSAKLGRRVFDRIDVSALLGSGASTAACQTSSPHRDWYHDQVQRFVDADAARYNALWDLDAYNVPGIEAWVLESNATPQYYGYTGQFTQVLVKTERDVKRFWDIPSARIQMVPMHGSVLLNVSKITSTYRIFYGLSEPDATARAMEVRNLVAGSPLLNGGNFAMFTFGAFAAAEDEWEPGSAPKIVMGDAYLEAWAAVGFGDVAPQGIFAHEFGHQIQFARHYLDDAYANVGTAAEQGRYIELMADAFAGYFLTHARGASMNRKRVEQFLQESFAIGDCIFDEWHHGTPTERMAATRFGFTVAAESQKQGQILTAAEFHARFVAAYPTLLD